MIDWYVLLFIAFTLVILLIDKIGSHRSIHEYTNTVKEMGLSEGTYSLVIQYMTGATVLIPFILTVKGGLSSFFIFTSSSIILYMLLRKWTVSQEKIDVILPGNFDSTHKINTAVLLIFVFSSIGSILIHTSLVVILFEDFFHQAPFLGVFLFLSFSYVLFGLGGKLGVVRVGSLILIGMLFTLSFSALTLYLRTGTDAVYQRLTAVEGIFTRSIWDFVFYALTFTLVMAGQTFTSFYFWESVKTVKPNHRLSALRYSSFSWNALLLSFTAFTMHLLSQTDTMTSLQLLESVVQSNTLISHIFIYACLFMIAIGTGHSLYSIISVFLVILAARKTQESSNAIVKSGYFFGMIIMVVLGLAGILLSGSIEKWLPFFLSFFISAAIPFFYIYIKDQFSLKHYSITVGLMSVAGVILTFTITEWWMIVPVTSLLTFVLHMLVTKFK